MKPGAKKESAVPFKSLESIVLALILDFVSVRDGVQFFPTQIGEIITIRISVAG